MPGGFKSLSMTTNVPIVATEAIDDEKAGNHDHAGRSAMFEVADALGRYQGTQAACSPAQEVERCLLLDR